MGRVGFVDRKRKVDEEQSVNLMMQPRQVGAVIRWGNGDSLELDANNLDPGPNESAWFASVPEGLAKTTVFRAAEKDFKDYLYQEKQLDLFHFPALKLFSEAGESEAEFRGRAQLVAREMRDAEVDKLRVKVQKSLDRLEKKLVKEERELSEDEADYDSRKKEELLSAGETLIGMLGLFGRRKRTGLSSAARKRRMTSRAKEDIQESKAEIITMNQEIADLEAKLQEEAEVIAEHWEDQIAEVSTYPVKPRRTDVRTDVVALAWAPFWEMLDSEKASRFSKNAIEAFR